MLCFLLMGHLQLRLFPPQRFSSIPPGCSIAGALPLLPLLRLLPLVPLSFLGRCSHGGHGGHSAPAESDVSLPLTSGAWPALLCLL